MYPYGVFRRRCQYRPARSARLPRLAACVLLLAAGAARADTQPDGAPPPVTGVTVPLRLDHGLLQQLLRAQLFDGPDGSHDLLADSPACSEIVLSEPTVAGSDGRLQVRARVRARIGVGTPGACAELLRWRGRIGVRGAPVIRAAGTAIGFEAERVRLVNAAGQVLPAGQQLQQLAEGAVRAFFRRYVIDLNAQLTVLGELLPTVLPRHSRDQIEALLATLRLATLRVTDDAVRADLQFAVEPASEPLPPEAPLSAEELARWQDRWQTMDALFVLAIKRYAAQARAPALRDGLLDVLIESRYRLSDMLAASTAGDADPVRDWFLASWRSLAPVLRRIALEQPGREPLLVLSMVAATDALAALDRLGPAVGLDISTDGLRRLARLVGGTEGAELLDYSGAVDPALRRLLEESLGRAPPSAWRFELSLFPHAIAADEDRLNRWAPRRDELADYLPQVAALLEAAAREAVAASDLDPAYAELFRRLVLTTAWQESCWRHYVVSDDRRLVPLRSGTGDVGLMQVNERVWRGFYDQQRLRWDIAYNGGAGVEVLLEYLVRYALRKGEHRQPGGTVNLARASYSAYNGGPSRLSRYRDDDASAYGKKVDRAFWDKYRQVAAGDELAVSRCLGGALSGRAVAGGGPGQGASRGAESAGAFTVQLGAFSSRAAAMDFTARHRLAEGARLRRRRDDGRAQYLVLYGSYETRTAAEAARQAELPALEAWVRPR